MNLSQQKCEACQPGAPAVGPEEDAELRREIPEWTRVEREGVPRLERVYTFPDFRSALAFTDRLGDIAEQEQHHPRIVLEWGRVEVAWWTHAIHGLHRNDYIMAARTDALYAEP
jgi:4a-hydroxytetrahydrobiopterin dehydratase